ncbi:hypothetical protein E2C01_036820 [Portunus trituberculatus]|uniref:Uncharacterized protein n=1 Tax=Portunus trituberculatus TaxID=210409 RepID=A0A5B7F7Q3_PORTR|nr:hypothetical protein [Portunus trituberculatus]
MWSQSYPKISLGALSSLCNGEDWLGDQQATEHFLLAYLREILHCCAGSSSMGHERKTSKHVSNNIDNHTTMLCHPLSMSYRIKLPNIRIDYEHINYNSL